jgi:deoxycytidylate deaminase
MKQRFIDLAIRAAKKSQHPDHRLGSVLVRGNKVISFGFNELKTHTKSPSPYRSIHSEFATILGLDKAEIDGSTMYIVRLRKDNSLGMAKPCIYCRKMLLSLNVSDIIYSDGENFTQENL